jgi:hypothetical protein
MASLISTLSIVYTTTPNVFFPRCIQPSSGTLPGLAEFNVTAETITLPYGGLQSDEKTAQAETKLQPPMTGEIGAYIGLICDGDAVSLMDSLDIKRRDSCDSLRTG